MLRRIGFMGLALVLLAMTGAPALAQAETEVHRYKETLTFEMPLCNLYRVYRFEGTFQGVAAITHDANGKQHMQILEHSQQLVATDLTTGDTYRAVLMDRTVQQGEIGDDRHSELWMQNYRLIGAGPDKEDVVLRFNVNIVSNASGEITAWVENGESQCPD